MKEKKNKSRRILFDREDNPECLIAIQMNGELNTRRALEIENTTSL
jgi:hypothetical protein